MYWTLKAKVEHILDSCPNSRNSDITLMVYIWKAFYAEKLTRSGGIVFVNVDKLHDLPREDHIKRIRAQIQNVEKRYLPTDEGVARRRGIASEEWRSYARNNFSSEKQTNLF